MQEERGPKFDSLNEEFYLSCVYDISRDPGPHRETLARLSFFYTKIIHAQSMNTKSFTIDRRGRR